MGFEDNVNMNDGMDNNFVVENKKKKDIEKKDPMVWDPPEKSNINNRNNINYIQIKIRKSL